MQHHLCPQETLLQAMVHHQHRIPFQAMGPLQLRLKTQFQLMAHHYETQPQVMQHHLRPQETLLQAMVHLQLKTQFQPMEHL